MSKLNDENPFKQQVKHEHFIHLMFEYITQDDIKMFIKLGRDYYSVCLRKSDEELYSAFTLQIYNGYVKENILEYLKVHIKSLYHNYERFNDSFLLKQAERWEKVYSAISNYLFNLSGDSKNHNIK
jgi:hypothetical protein